jgi:hypothetical protein
MGQALGRRQRWERLGLGQLPSARSGYSTPSLTPRPFRRLAVRRPFSWARAYAAVKDGGPLFNRLKCPPTMQVGVSARFHLPDERVILNHSCH